MQPGEKPGENDEAPKPPKPIPSPPEKDKEDDVTPAFLGEWTEYKTEIGWKPKADRSEPEPLEPEPSATIPVAQHACVLGPFCPFAAERAA
jgi:hypothetical protein